MEAKVSFLELSFLYPVPETRLKRNVRGHIPGFSPSYLPCIDCKQNEGHAGWSSCPKFCWENGKTRRRAPRDELVLCKIIT